MLKISKRVEYALMSLKYMTEKAYCPDKRKLNDDCELTTARELETQFSVPFDTVAKVLQTLNTKGVLHSVKGTKGGYSLKRDLSQITYAQLIEYIEGKKSMMVCLTSKGTICDLHNTCNIISPLGYLNQKVTDFFAQLTIAEILFGETVKNTSNINLANELHKSPCPMQTSHKDAGEEIS